MKYKVIKLKGPEVGAQAEHKSGTLDARPVTRISEDGKQIWLRLGPREHGPFKAENYRYYTVAQL